MGNTQHRSRLSRRQLALLHVARRELGLDDTAYRDLLESATGVRSAADLDYAGFRALLRRLERLGFRPRGAPRDYGRRPGMATPAQIDYIRGLWRRYRGRDDEAALRNWLHRRFGISDLRFLDRGMAHQTLVALKAMVARRREGQGARG